MLIYIKCAFALDVNERGVVMHARQQVGTSRMPLPTRDEGIWMEFLCGAVLCFRPYEAALITAAGGGPVASWGTKWDDFQVITFHPFVKQDGGAFEHVHFWEQHPQDTPKDTKIERPIATAMPTGSDPVANFRATAFNPTILRLAFHTSYLVELMREDGDPRLAAQMRAIATDLTDDDVARALAAFDTHYAKGDWLDSDPDMPMYWRTLHHSRTSANQEAA